jgi:hypothetical protein
MLRGERHAQGEQNGRGSSMCMGSGIKRLYIASLHKIEDNFVSVFEFEKQLYISWKKSATSHLYMGAAETHWINDKGSNFRIQSQTKAYLRFYRHVLL